MVRHRLGNSGFVTLISVLVVAAVGAVISIALLFLGLTASRLSFKTEQSQQTKALTNACAEEALQKIKSSPSFTGSGTIVLGQGTCGYLVTKLGGANRQITASGTVGAIIRKVKIIIDKINPKIHIVSWQEVADL